MIEHAFELALAAHRADDFPEAERRYRVTGVLSRRDWTS